MGHVDGVRFCDACGVTLKAAEGRTVDDRLLCKRCAPRFFRLRAVRDHLRAWRRHLTLAWRGPILRPILGVVLVLFLAVTEFRVRGLETKVRDLESKIGGLESSVSRVGYYLEDKVGDLESQLSDVESKVDDLESGVSDLESKVDNFEYKLRFK
jgi:outer membrane murein-binding lipoprotein Lpp